MVMREGRKREGSDMEEVMRERKREEEGSGGRKRRTEEEGGEWCGGEWCGGGGEEENGMEESGVEEVVREMRYNLPLASPYVWSADGPVFFEPVEPFLSCHSNSSLARVFLQAHRPENSNVQSVRDGHFP